MYTHLIIRYGELFLKGKNRHFFEQKLLKNIQKQLPNQEIFTPHGRLVMNYFDQHQSIRKIFGLVSYSPAIKVEKDILKIQQAVIPLLNRKTGTFRVDTSRADKRFSLTSPQLNQSIGEYIENHTPLTFSLKQAQHLISIEINHDAAYIFTETISCAGGLPVGVEGTVITLIENQASLLAAILLMKRGCDILPLAFTNQDISLLLKYSPKPIELRKVHSFQEIEQLLPNKILVSGQTFDNYKRYDPSLVIIRPLIAYNDQQVQEQLDYFKNL